MQMKIDWPVWREAMVMAPLLASVPYLFLRNTGLHSTTITLLIPVGVWLLIVGIHAATPQERVNLSTIAASTALAVLPWFVLILFLERYALWAFMGLLILIDRSGLLT